VLPSGCANERLFFSWPLSPVNRCDFDDFYMLFSFRVEIAPTNEQNKKQQRRLLITGDAVVQLLLLLPPTRAEGTMHHAIALVLAKEQGKNASSFLFLSSGRFGT
jgi:hypothetical protein